MKNIFPNQLNNRELAHYEHNMYVKGDLSIQYFSLGLLLFAIGLTLTRQGTDFLNTHWLIIYVLGVTPFTCFSIVS